MKKILVIEDQAQTRNVFLDCLTASGFYAIGAENGLDGLQQVKEQFPDLIICDIMMPQLDGYGVLNTLRQDPVTATIPFIFLSAKETRTDLRRGMDLGADDYLTKPCTIEELLNAIATRLKKHAALRQRFAAEAQSILESPAAPDPTDSIELQSFFPSVPQINEVFDFIEANYYRPIGLEDVAQAVGYSPSYLTNLTRRLTGQAVQGWIIKRRMAAARSLLLETNQIVEQIATQVGYHHTVHFFRQFRQLHGTTPQAWRNANRAANWVQTRSKELLV